MAEESKYEYTPSVAAAAIFIVVFLILLVVHTFRLFKTRTWFCTSFVVGTILEIIGYGARAVGKSKPAAIVPYIIQALLILLAPILFAASVYMFLGRLIQATGCAHYSMIRPTRLTKIFVGGDVLCFLIQAVGAAILAGSDSKKGSDLGKAVILTGLCLQMAIFAFFVAIAAVWHRRVSALGSEKPQIGQWNWLRYQNMLYIVSGIITLRNLFRVIEYAMGKDGYLLANEWPIYVFDATLMAGVLVICSYWYIGPTLKQAADLVDSELEIIPQNSQ